MKKQGEFSLNKGDVFHDGFFGWWICNTKTPNGKKLFIYPLDDLGKDPNRKGCKCYHELESFNTDGIDLYSNLYKNPEIVLNLIGKDNFFREAFLEFDKNSPS